MTITPSSTAPLPKIIFGTSSLGNLYSAPSFETKVALVSEVMRHNQGIPLFDSAGKYGAGLSLESLGNALKALDVKPNQVMISNKLGWKRIPLATPEPTFEPGAWVDIENDAVQTISYDGIMECYEQGNALLGDYNAELVSVHDPDEYLSAAADQNDLKKRQQDVLSAYRALSELKEQGKVRSIGIGAKDISVIDFVSDHIKLDWAMFACSLTPYTHTPFTKGLLKKLGNQGVDIINSAVFNAGFLIGGDHFDYQKITVDTHPEIFAWRDQFFLICEEYKITPAAACVQFSFLFKEVKSIALNTSSPKRVAGNIKLANAIVPSAFWKRLEGNGLIDLS